MSSGDLVAFTLLFFLKLHGSPMRPRFVILRAMQMVPTAIGTGVRTISGSWLLLFLAMTLIGISSVSAQSGSGRRFGTLGGVEPAGQYPSPQYYVALEAYRAGDLEQDLTFLTAL